MFIDTIMALWNRIWYGRLKRVLVTSFLFGMSIVLLVIIIGVPILSHSSPVVRQTVQSVDTANKKEDALPTQPRLDGLSTPPPTPTMLPVLPSPPPPPTIPVVVSKQQYLTELATEAPVSTVMIIVPTHTPAKIFIQPAAKHQKKHVVIKAIQPSPTPSSITTPVPTSTPNTPVASTPTPELLPTPMSTTVTIQVGDMTPTPEITGTVQLDPTPTMTK